MEKLLTFPTVTEKGVHAFNVDDLRGREHLEKTAVEYHPEIAAFIRQAKPIPGFTQILLTALGASEFWNFNSNADYFPEASLAHVGKDYGHKTFEYYAKVFKHHNNKIALGHTVYGDVLLSIWNDRMKRVELIVKLDNTLCADDIARINRGESVSVSMGCNVVWDECQHENADIITPTGKTKISKIQTGDSVLTHKGRFKQVTHVFQNKAPEILLEFDLSGETVMPKVTGNHPMWYLRRTDLYYDAYKRKHDDYQSRAKPKFIEASAIQRGDYLVRPIPKPGSVQFDYRIAYLIGQYLGDGHIMYAAKGPDPTCALSVSITTDAKDRDTIVRRITEYAFNLGWDFSVRTGAKHEITTSIRNREFAKYCNIVAGIKEGKNVPSEVFSWTAENIKWFLGGYIDADGHFRDHGKNPSYTLTSSSVSEQLTRDMQLLLHIVGISASTSIDRINPKWGSYTTKTEAYKLNVPKSQARLLKDYSIKVCSYQVMQWQSPHNFFFEHEGITYLALKIRNIRSVPYDKPYVYNLSVEGDETYVADTVVTHNCSICGNRAPKREDYCRHAMWNLGRLDPETGKLVYVINRYPRFKDISIVTVGADSTAKTLLKVAGAPKQPIISSALLAEKAAQESKIADQDKKVESNISPALSESLETITKTSPKLVASEPEFPKTVLDALAGRPLEESLSTILHTGILPKPQELQFIVIKRMGNPDLAEQLHTQHMLAFDPSKEPDISSMAPDIIAPKHVNESLLNLLMPLLADRSYAAPILKIRIIKMLDKNAAFGENTEQHKTKWDISPTIVFPALAALYYFLKKHGPMAPTSGIDATIIKHPILASALAVGAITGITSAMQPVSSGYFINAPKPEHATNWLPSMQRADAHPITKIGSSALALRLFGVAPAAYLASGYEQYKTMMDPSYRERQSIPAKIVEKHPGILALAPTLEYAAGSPISGPALEKLKGLKQPLKKFLKRADLQDNIVKCNSIDQEIIDLAKTL